MKQRLVYIDRLKGFAIYLVVLGHMYQYMVQNGTTTKLFSIIYAFHMPLFFFLSGYISEKTNKIISSKDVSQYLFKKAYTLLVPLLTWAILTYFLIDENPEYSLAGIAKIVVLQFTDPNLWFLLMLFKIFLVYVPFFLLVKKINTKNTLFIDLIVTTLLTLIVLLLTKFIFKINSLAFLLNFIFFMFGAFLTKHQFIRTYLEKTYVFIICAIGFVIFAYMYDFHQTELIKIKAFKLLASFFGVITFYNVSKKVKLLKTTDFFLTKIGKWTLVIYTTHFMFFYIVENKWLVSNDLNIFLAFIIINILAILLIYICVIIGNLIKYINILDFLLYGNYRKTKLSK